MKSRISHFILSLFLLLMLVAGTRATDITIGEMTIAGFYPPAAPPQITGTVNTSGTTVTAVSGVTFQPFRSPASPGWPAGMRIRIASTTYSIASVESATSLTLTTSAGSQTAAALTVYPFVELRLWALSTFTPPELTTVIQQGSASSWYQRYGVSIISNVAYLPAITLVATTDAPNNQEALAARWYAGFYAGNTFVQDFQPSFRLSHAPTSTTWPVIRQFNAPNTNVQRLNYEAYNTTQTMALLQQYGIVATANYLLKVKSTGIGGENAAAYQTGSNIFFTGSIAPTGLAPAVVTPSQLTSNQNNYAPSAGVTYRLSSDASRTLTGWTAAALDGTEIKLVNVGSFDIVLAHQSSSSTAANRWLSAYGLDITLMAGTSAIANYDATTTRWRVRLLD